MEITSTPNARKLTEFLKRNGDLLANASWRRAAVAIPAAQGRLDAQHIEDLAVNARVDRLERV